MTKTFGNFTDLMDFSRTTSGTALRKVSYGSELITNGTFDTDLSDWVTTSTNATNTVTWNSGAVDFVSDGSTSLGLNQYAVFTVGKLYQLKIDVTVNSGNVAGIKVQYTGTDSSIGVITATGSYTFNFIAGGVNLDIYRRTGGSATNVTIDNISVKEVTLDSGTDDPVVFNHPADIPRIEYATDGTVKGLLIEEARTNLVTYSEAFNNAAWIKDASVVVTSNAAVSPDGAQTADEVEMVDSGDYIYDSIAVSAETVYTLSWYIKAGTANLHVYGFYDESNAAMVTQAQYTITDGEDVGNGWYRISKNITTPTGCTSLRTYPLRANDSGGLVSGALGTSFLWGAQLEAGSFPTSYIPTSGATATRAADLASIAVENFGYNQDEGTLVVEFDADSWAQNSNTAAFSRVLEFTGNNGSNADGVFRSSNEGAGTLVRYRFNESDSTTPAIGAGNLNAVTGVHKVAVALGQDDAAIVMDGGTPATGSGTAAMDLYDDIYLGRSSGSTNFLNGHIRDFQYYPRRLTNRQLQELTGATNTYDYTTVEAGTITRSPVATGADLVGYGGFNHVNYFQQPYNSDLDFGTGDFSIMLWAKVTHSVDCSLLYLGPDLSSVHPANGFNIWTYGGFLKGTAAGSNLLLGNSDSPFPSGSGASFNHVVVGRTGGKGFYYLNGAKQVTDLNNTGSIGSTSNSLYVGEGHYGNQGSTIALLRISATAPTATQIAKIYNDEKHLFQEGAQATLYGSSDAVTALAHDDTTNLLHVGTSAGRSVFQGLRRVENTTDAVGTAISASNGLVVEE